VVSGFGELEAQIMDRLWSWGRPTTVRELYEDLATNRQLAYTTVLTVTDNLYRKGWLVREKVGKAHQYQPVTSREEYTARLMREALDGSADTAEAFAHFVRQISEEEARALRSALRRLGRQR
jgi:predicted transcriptional regulator